MKHLYNTAGRLSFLWVTHLPEEPFTRRLFSSPVWKILDQIPGQKNILLFLKKPFLNQNFFYICSDVCFFKLEKYNKQEWLKPASKDTCNCKVDN